MGQRTMRQTFDQRFGGDRETRVPGGDVEVMDGIAVVILIHHHPRVGRRRQREVETALIVVGPRLHARLHHALGDGRVVGEARDVADRITHGSGLWALGFGLRSTVFGYHHPLSTIHHPLTTIHH